MHFVLLVLYAILNRVRGAAILPKVPCYMLFGVLTCATGYVCGVTGDAMFWGLLWLLSFGGSWLGFMWCWGKYFPSLIPTYDQVCVPIVDKITTALYCPYDANTPDPQVLNWKTIGMSWRWIIFFAPKYVLLTGFRYYNGASADAMIEAFSICILLLALVGVLYRIGFTIAGKISGLSAYAVAISEIMTGFFVIGVADWVVL